MVVQDDRRVNDEAYAVALYGSPTIEHPQGIDPHERVR